MASYTKTLFGSLAIAAVVAAGCGSSASDTTAREAATTISSVASSVAGNASSSGQDVLASLQSEGERVWDDIRSSDTGKADTAKKALLDKCRDSLEDLRKQSAPTADRVEKLCDEIRDAKTDAAWTKVQSELDGMTGTGSGASSTMSTTTR